MATELGKAYVQIMPSAKGISGSIQNTLDPESKKAGKKSGLSIVGAIKGAIITAGIGKVLGKSLSEGGKLEQSIGGIETLFKDNADTVVKYANEAYKTVGVSSNEYMENVTSFSASLLQSMGGDTQKAAKVAHMAMVDMGDNANKMGTDMRDIQNAYQGFAKGNYTMLDNLKLGYGGTKTEMERLLKDATKLTGVKYNLDNLGDVYTAVNAIQEEIGITGTTALEAEETIQGSLGAMKSAFINTMGAIAIGENVEGSFKALAESTSTFLFGNLLPMVGEIIGNIPSGIATLIETGAPHFISAGNGLIQNVTSGITNGIPMLLEKITEFMGNAIVWVRREFPIIAQTGVEMILDFANGILSGLPSTIESIATIMEQMIVFLVDSIPTILQTGYDLITGFAKGIKENLPAILESIDNMIFNLLFAITADLPKILEKGKELIGKLAKGIWDSLPAIMDSITKILGKLLDAIIKYLPILQRKGIELISKLAQGIWSNLPQIITTIGNLLSKLIGAIAQRIPGFISMGFDLIINLGEGLIKAIPGIVSKIPQVIVALVKTFGGLVGQFVGIGGDIIKGLWKGISDVQSWILGKIKGFVSSITDGIKGFFGIKSPSKVMANEVGQWLPKGLAEGIEDNTRPVSQAMEDLANLTTGTLESELALNAVSAGSLSFDAGVSSGRDEDRRLYDIIVRALADGTRIEWNDREIGRLVRNFA